MEHSVHEVPEESDLVSLNYPEKRIRDFFYALRSVKPKMLARTASESELSDLFKAYRHLMMNLSLDSRGGEAEDVIIEVLNYALASGHDLTSSVFDYDSLIKLNLTSSSFLRIKPVFKVYILKRFDVWTEDDRPNIKLIIMANTYFPDDEDVKGKLREYLNRLKSSKYARHEAMDSFYIRLAFGCNLGVDPDDYVSEEVQKKVLSDLVENMSRSLMILRVKPELLTEEHVKIIDDSGLSSKWSLLAELIQLRPELFHDEALKKETRDSLIGHISDLMLKMHVSWEQAYILGGWSGVPTEMLRYLYVRSEPAQGQTYLKAPPMAVQFETESERLLWGELAYDYFGPGVETLSSAYSNYNQCVDFYRNEYESGSSLEDILCLIAQQFYSPVAFTYQLKSAGVGNAFHPEGAFGNCEARAMGMGVLIERIFLDESVVDEIYIEMFENHVRLVLKINGQLCLMEGERPIIGYVDPEGVLVPFGPIARGYLGNFDCLEFKDHNERDILAKFKACHIDSSLLGSLLPSHKKLPFYRESYSGRSEVLRTSGSSLRVRPGMGMGLLQRIRNFKEGLSSIFAPSIGNKPDQTGFKTYDKDESVVVDLTPKAIDQANKARRALLKENKVRSVGKIWKGRNENSQKGVSFKPEITVMTATIPKQKSRASQGGFPREVQVPLFSAGIALASGLLILNSIETEAPNEPEQVYASVLDHKIAESSLRFTDLDMMIVDKSKLTNEDCWVVELPDRVYWVDQSAFTYLSKQDGLRELRISGDSMISSYAEEALNQSGVDLVVELEGVNKKPGTKEIRKSYEEVLTSIVDENQALPEVLISPCN